MGYSWTREVSSCCENTLLPGRNGNECVLLVSVPGKPVPFRRTREVTAAIPVLNLQQRSVWRFLEAVKQHLGRLL